MNKHVPDVERCKRLKELGFPQDTKFYWLIDNLKTTNPLIISKGTKFEGEAIAAPLATELLAEFTSLGMSKYQNEYYFIFPLNTPYIRKNGDNLCNALADLWCEMMR